jgi:hypothetical protein
MWGADLGNGTGSLNGKANTLFVWCVRGGQGVDAQ